jgi:hypothetical protein
VHLIVVMAAIAISLDCISIGIVGSIAIGSDCILIGVNGGFNSGCEGGSFDQFHWAVLGYQPQQSIQQLRQEDLRLSAERVLRAIIIMI